MTAATLVIALFACALTAEPALGDETTVADFGSPVSRAFSLAKSTGDAQRIDELTTATEDWAAQPDGSLVRTVAAAPIRVPSGSAEGGWRDMDLSVQPRGDGRYAPKASPTPVLYGGQGDSVAAQLDTSDGTSVRVAAMSSLPAPLIQGSRVIYRNVAPETDLVFETTPTGFEQFFIINERPVDDLTALPLFVGGDGLSVSEPSISSGDAYVLGGRSGGRVGSIGTASAWDSASGSASDPAHNSISDIRVAPTSSGVSMVIVPDSSFLDDEDTQYPVIVDPSFSIGSGASDTYVSESNPTTKYVNDASLKTGITGGDTFRSFVRFNGSATDGQNVQGMTISSATLKLWQTSAPTCTATMLRAYALTSLPSFTNVTWNAQPSYDSATSQASSFNKGFSSSCAAGWISIPVAQPTQYIADHDGIHFAYELRSSEANSSGYKVFSSANGPHVPSLSITYSSSTPDEPPITATPVVDEIEGDSFQTADGWTVALSDGSDPSVRLIEEDGGGPEYVADVTLSDSSSIVVSRADVHMTRDASQPGRAKASWPVDRSLIEPGQTYSLSVRVHRDGASEPFVWSPTSRTPILIASKVAAPIPVTPSSAEVEALGQVPFVATVGPDVPAGSSTQWSVEAQSAGGWAPWSSGEGVVSSNAQVSFTAPYQSRGHYRWRARVLSSVYSDFSPWSEFVVSSAPSTPTGVSFEANRDVETVSYVLPPDPEGAPVDAVTITVNPGALVQTVAPGDSATFSGLGSGTYSVTVASHNLLGDSEVLSSQLVRDGWAATAPRNLDVQVNGRDAHIAWDVPDDLGSDPIDHYTVRLLDRDCSDSWNESVVTSTSIDLHDLDVDCEYLVQVMAVTNAGAGSSVATVFYAFDVPSAPNAPTLRASSDSLDVLWPTPSENGRPVDGYEVRQQPGGLILSASAAAWPTQKTSVFDLDPEVTYSFEVRAHNEAGWGGWSPSVSGSPTGTSVDSDGDGLIDAVEIRMGTDPMRSDSDSDGLNDGAELEFFAGEISPLSSDTDGDGVSDAQEDLDADGLSNFDEVRLGGDPLSADSDGDGLSDSAEYAGGTRVSITDSDADGVTDGLELNLGTNPLIVDSDGDGIADGDETVSREIAAPMPPLGAQGVDSAVETTRLPTARVSGQARSMGSAGLTVVQADVPGVLTVGARIDGTADNAAPAAAQSRSTGDHASDVYIDFPITSAVSDQLGNLHPVVWNDETDSWEFSDNDVSVSTAEDTIRMYSPDLGLSYAIVDLDQWAANSGQCEAAIAGHPALDVQVIIDGSAEVQSEDVSHERFNALRGLIGSLNPADRVSLREFGETGFLARAAPGASGSPDGWIMDVGQATQLERPAAAQLSLDALEDSERGYDYTSSAASLRDVRNDAEYALGLDDGNPYGDSGDGGLTCRIHVMVFVTNGEWQPDPNLGLLEDHLNWIPFVERTDVPVHVLDLGVNESQDSSWLVQLAQTSHGTYSYVPTAQDLWNWIDEVSPSDYEMPTNPHVDSDGDGLPDYIEIEGFIPSMTTASIDRGVRIATDPYNPDTDGDGLPDGLEVGEVVQPGQFGTPAVVSADVGPHGYRMISNPTLVDSDWDEMADIDEFGMEYNAWNKDEDGDGLVDGLEYEVGSDSFVSDTDADSFDDTFEFINLSYGYDPVQFNELESKTQWLEDAFVGLFCGEACPIDSVGWLAGNLVSGVLVFGDVRDLVVFIGNGDVVAAGFTALGILPAIGDATSAVVKIRKFLTVSTRLGVQAGAFRMGVWVVRRVDSQAAASRTVARASAGAAGETAAVLGGQLLNGLDPALEAGLRRMGMTEIDDMLKVTQFMDEKLVERMINSNANYRFSQPGETVQYPDAVVERGFVGDTKDDPSWLIGQRGDQFVAGMYGYDYPTPQAMPRKKATLIGNRSRFYDWRYPGPPAVDFEIKAGFIRGARVRNQLLRDMEHVQTSDVGVRWVFVASERSGKFGMSESLLDLFESQSMEKPRVEFEIILPW